MSLLSVVPTEDAQGKVAELYQIFQDTFGLIPNAFKAMSVSPEMLDLHWRNIRYYQNHPAFSAKLVTFIRLLISQQANCRYCINLNTAILMQEFGLSQDQIATTMADPTTVPLDDRESALLQFVLKGTMEPLSVTQADINQLHEHDYHDKDIFDALNLGARQVSFDIVLNAFKVENDF